MADGTLQPLWRRSGADCSYTRAVSVYADLIRYRELFANLFRRDLQARYRGSVLGVAWSLALPLLLMGVYVLVFSVLLRVVDIEDYPLFLLSGLAVWLFFATALQAASRSILENAPLVTKVRFPRQLVPFSIVGTHLVTLGVMLGVLIVVNAIVRPETRATVLLSVPLAVLFVGLVGGLSLALAAMNVLFRDVEHLLAALLLPWFFLTPVLYTLDRLPEGVTRHETLIDILTYANFVTPPLEAIRDPLFWGELPRAVDVAYLVAATAVALVLGSLVFRRLDDQIAVEL
jgi:ABC-type polysaccharide/polyol phosphate export permease